MIEEALKQLALRGQLSLTVFPTSNGTYQASVSFDNRKSWRVEMAADPVTATRMALGLVPGRSGMTLEQQAESAAYGSTVIVSEKPTDNTTQGGIFD